jgi:hypothetical protein
MKREKHGKKQAVDYMGSKCSICKYNQCIRALEFHHIDPNKKSKHYNKRFKVWSFDRQKKNFNIVFWSVPIAIEKFTIQSNPLLKLSTISP